MLRPRAIHASPRRGRASTRPVGDTHPHLREHAVRREAPGTAGGPWQRVVPIADPRRRAAAMRLGMWLFVASLAMLFAATSAALLFVRFAPGNAEAWRGTGLPWQLLPGTLLLAASSISLERSMRNLRRARRRSFERGLRLAFWFGAAFLAVQGWGWGLLVAEAGPIVMAGDSASRRVLLGAWTVLLLTTLHAAHVVGGLVPMGVAMRRATERRYSASSPGALPALRIYWHFLGAVWIGILATLALMALA